MKQELEKQIRRAIEAGAYVTGARLWEEYASLIRARIEEGVATEADIADARALLEWARITALCARAHADAHLQAARAAAAYR